MNNYVFNLETTKIELHFEKSEYDALSDDDRRLLKGAFLWSRMGACWVSRAKEPNLWRAKEVAKKLGFTKEQREGERLTYSEQLERQAEHAEARADRYDEYANNASKRGTQMQSVFDGVRGDISFFTQPNIDTSLGRAFTNQRNRMYERYNKGFEEYRKSDYFKDKAEMARGTASQAQYENPTYLVRRIKECKKRCKEIEKTLVQYEETLYKLEKGEELKNTSDELIPIERIKNSIEYLLEQYEVSMDKQAYLENRLDECGGFRFNKDNIKVGYIVLIKRWGHVEIISTGTVNVGFKILTGGAVGSTHQTVYAEIDKVIKSEEKKRTAHPFVVGEQFTAKKWDSSMGLGNGKYNDVVYEIIKVSDTTIKLQALDTGEKPITRKPTLTYAGKWRFSINNSYGNTFCKENEGTA